MAPALFDRAALRRARERSAPLFPQADFLHRRTLDSLRDRLEDVARSFDTGLLSGAGGADFLAFSSPKIRRLVRMDLAFRRLGPDAPPRVSEKVQADVERLPFTRESFDIVLSLLELHAVNDLPGALAQIRAALRPGGLFLGALCGRGTLDGLHAALGRSETAIRGGMSPRCHPFADGAQMAALLQGAGFALPVVDGERTVATYSGLPALMHDLRAMGEVNVLSERVRLPTPRRLFPEAEAHWRQTHADGQGVLNVPFAVIFLSGWAPDS